MDKQRKFKVGDSIYKIHNKMIYDKLRIEKVTPTGRGVSGSLVFDPPENGYVHLRGQDRYSFTSYHFETPELKKEYETSSLRGWLKEEYENFSLSLLKEIKVLVKKRTKKDV